MNRYITTMTSGKEWIIKSNLNLKNFVNGLENVSYILIDNFTALQVKNIESIQLSTGVTE